MWIEAEVRRESDADTVGQRLMTLDPSWVVQLPAELRTEGHVARPDGARVHLSWGGPVPGSSLLVLRRTPTGWEANQLQGSLDALSAEVSVRASGTGCLIRTRVRAQPSMRVPTVLHEELRERLVAWLEALE